jgi:hypothetical protein
MIMTGRPKRAIAVVVAMMEEVAMSQLVLHLRLIPHPPITTTTLTITITIMAKAATTAAAILIRVEIREVIRVVANLSSSRIIRCLACNHRKEAATRSLIIIKVVATPIATKTAMTLTITAMAVA